ncbi:DnaJ domain-containing protein / J55 / JDP55 [Leishmania donovani]|uniref:DnaJ_domain_containing_protein_putative/Pfam:PF00 226 n=1 Tax=Leishmania donovani TaxID=5661 RepID=A0A6J8FEC1_LEIDO|nr:DnaJ domain-containing protein / J55 / JDP55 [Leishmania donovani]VDZ46135.1 DnaJ_domain_containing_protein_putative/Pfam:PF00226 [Leishmania donovani]
MESKASLPPHYECLGVDPSINSVDLARQYKKLSLQLHPDRAAYRDDAANEVHVQERYQRITEAYAVLSDPEKRRAYDAKHGVNFQSRLARLQAVIGQHNTMAMQRSAMGRKTTDSASTSSPTTDEHGAQHLHAAPHKDSAERTIGDDDEEDYDPNDVLAPPRGALHQAGSSGFYSGDSCDADGDGDYIARLFSLNLRVGAEAAPKTRNGVPVAQYQAITLTRALSSPASPYASTWGLVFEKNELVGLDGEYLEELERIAGLAAVPFPSSVQQINDTMVLPTTDVPRLLSRLYEAESTRSSAVSPVTGQTASTNKDARSGQSKKVCEVCVEAPTDSSLSSPTEHLHMVLAYSTVTYDLVGEVHLLGDDDVISRLVPSWCVAPQLSLLMPDATVLSVNNTHVRSAAELRAALRAAVLDGEDEDVMQAVKRARKSRAVVVEFCQLPFLCSCSSLENVSLSLPPTTSTRPRLGV